MNANIGWECPKCGSCYSPIKMKCDRCSGTIPPMVPQQHCERCPVCDRDMNVPQLCGNTACPYGPKITCQWTEQIP
jgi:hypothetical protein